jgi:peptidoglycan/xylan/chitin deacetylase (PgdA/CDA1 family)
MTGWPDLQHELDLWCAQGHTAALWWRDDDAVTATPALDRLLALRAALDVPLALAAIPARAEPSLAAALAADDGVAILQHGYAHVSHAAGDEDKIELGGRPRWDVAAELARGRETLDGLFGEKLLPVMVPPWNRIHPGVIALLPGLGYGGLSTFSARGAPAPGLVAVNAHVDIIDWLETRGFCGETAALDAAVGHLAARRGGAADPEEPTGLLTHHLAHDTGCWDFIRRFVSETAAHPAVRWVAAAVAFETAP